MKLAIIIENYHKNIGGAETSVGELFEEFKRRGIDVFLIAAKSTVEDRRVIALCNKIPGKRVNLKIFEKALKRYFESNSFDIIHSVLPFQLADVYQPRASSFAVIIEHNAKSYNRPFKRIFKRYTSFLNFRRHAFFKREAQLCRASNKTLVACLSQYVANQFIKHYALSEDRLRVIQNGINTNIAEDHFSEKLQAAIENLPLSKERYSFFLFAGYNFRLKGLANLIESIKLSLSYDLETVPVIIVSGNDKNDEYKTLSMKMGVEDNFIFVGKTNGIKSAMSFSDVVVLPTYDDACSRIILESIAMAKPVITTSYNGAAEFIQNGRHGVVVDEPEDIQGLANSISYFCERGNQQKAQNAILEDNLRYNVSVERHVNELLELYRTLTKS